MNDKWLAWSPLIWRGPPGEAPPESTQKTATGDGSALARCFHHENKDEAAAKREAEPSKDSSQQGEPDEKRHGFFHDLFHKQDAEPAAGN